MKIEWITELPLPHEMMEIMEAAAQRCIECEGIRTPCSVTVRLCSDEKITEINKAFRGLNRSTDVLSFPSIRYPSGMTARSCEHLIRREFDDESGTCFLGDIILSVPHVFSQAEEYGHSAEREASYLLVHGICHLMGYDHMTEEDKKQMRSLEEKILPS